MQTLLIKNFKSISRIQGISTFNRYICNLKDSKEFYDSLSENTIIEIPDFLGYHLAIENAKSLGYINYDIVLPGKEETGEEELLKESLAWFESLSEEDKRKVECLQRSMIPTAY